MFGIWAVGVVPQTSRINFCPGRVALSERTNAIRAARDTPVADESAPVQQYPVLRRISPSIHCSKDSSHSVGFILLMHTLALWPTVTTRRNGLIVYVTGLHRDHNGAGDAAKISPRVPSTCAQNTILSLLIIHIIPSAQIYVAIYNPSLVPSVLCLTTTSYLWNDMHAADNVFYAENAEKHHLPVSVSNGSGPSLRVRVRVQTEPLPNWRFGSSINPNCPLR